MAEATQYKFSYKELAELMVKKQGLHEGIWGIWMRFGIQAANTGPSEEEIVPTAILPVIEIGLQRFEKENSLSVDASKVNPATGQKKTK